MTAYRDILNSSEFSFPQGSIKFNQITMTDLFIFLNFNAWVNKTENYSFSTFHLAGTLHSNDHCSSSHIIHNIIPNQEYVKHIVKPYKKCGDYCEMTQSYHELHLICSEDIYPRISIPLYLGNMVQKYYLGQYPGWIDWAMLTSNHKTLWSCFNTFRPEKKADILHINNTAKIVYFDTNFIALFSSNEH